ncbi:hypothetical protein F3Y22_tig00112503pilonHSYRG00123 [Hibiscus syriacus]|uniref:Uncharacterized protein n=1 Tax=Hibiscus syriacus TaxID=106335 RepID=A0A6A2XGG4_HIBSY|nr:hypothetical protein F3Y22_tig00112503pilonHSYRG00123 [Hibiscus syriacus]
MASDRSKRGSSVSHQTSSGDSPFGGDVCGYGRPSGVFGRRGGSWNVGVAVESSGSSSSGWDVSLGYHHPRMSSSHYELFAGDDVDLFPSVDPLSDEFEQRVKQVLLIMNFFFLLQMSPSHYELKLEKLIHQVVDLSKRLNKFFSL